MNGYDRMNDYDKKAWDALERERQRQLSHSSKRLMPAAVRRQVRQLGQKAYEGASSVPGFDQAEELIEQVFGAAGGVGGKFAAESLATGRITGAYRKAGHGSVERISDIAQLRLRDVDEVKPRLGMRYIAAGVTSGAAAGFAVSGGELAALVGVAAGGAAGGVAGGGVGAAPGAGVGAAPGAGVVIGAMAADTAAVLLASARAIFHTAAYYGYDVDRPEERLRALGVLNYATATGQAAKNRAYLEAEKLAGMIVRNATWKQLDQNVLTRIVRRVFDVLGMRLTKKSLAVAVPILGVAVGAAINGRALQAAEEGADLLYRQQFLCDKYVLPFPSGNAPEHDGGVDAEPEELPLADMIDEETDVDDGTPRVA